MGAERYRDCEVGIPARSKISLITSHSNEMYKTLTTLLAGMMLACPALAQEPSKMKMSTDVPDGVATPDKVETRLGTLTLKDGIPDEATAKKIYDNLDFQRGVQAYLNSMQIASLSGMRSAYLQFGPANQTVLCFEDLMDSKALWLTPNTVSVYFGCWVETKDEPLVIETPPNVLGLIDDAWFDYVADFGNAGPDKGKGGTFIILPPGYDESEIPNLKQQFPDAYIFPSKTHGHWCLWRGFQVDGSPKPSVEATKKHFRIYSVSEKVEKPQMNFINMSGRYHNTIHRMDYGFFEEVNEVIQREPIEGADPEILGQLASIGIEKGKSFEPDPRMERILKEAADVAAVTARTIASRPRGDSWYFFPGKRRWNTPFVGGDHEFAPKGARLLDARSFFFFYATGITPAMTKEMVGFGSQYAAAYLDADGNPFDGNKTYKINLPAPIPAKDFWSFTIYDNQTRSMLQTDQQFPGIDSTKSGLQKNRDGSVDIYVGPKAPKGAESNWIQSAPGKGWNILLRLYGPLAPWFERTWIPGDFKLVE